MVTTRERSARGTYILTSMMEATIARTVKIKEWIRSNTDIEVILFIDGTFTKGYGGYRESNARRHLPWEERSILLSYHCTL